MYTSENIWHFIIIIINEQYIFNTTYATNIVLNI